MIHALMNSQPRFCGLIDCHLPNISVRSLREESARILSDSTALEAPRHYNCCLTDRYKPVIKSQDQGYSTKAHYFSQNAR